MPLDEAESAEDVSHATIDPADVEKAAGPTKAASRRVKAAEADPSANKSAIQADTPDSPADARAALAA